MTYRRAWTEQDLEAVRLCYGCTDQAVLAEHLGRSRKALAAKAYRLRAHGRRNALILPAKRRYVQALALECARLGVDLNPALAGCRMGPFVLARARVFAALRRDGFSLRGIAIQAGHFDHTSVRHAIIKLEDYERRRAA